MRGAWIEMLILRLNRPDGDGSLPVRGAWIEISGRAEKCPPRRSLPVRGAWIEMISNPLRNARFRTSLPVRGAWIEINCQHY